MKFETFAEKIRQNYFGYVRMRINDPDIVNQIINDSLIKMYGVYEKIDTNKTKLNTYYFKVLNNVIIDYYRKNKSNLICTTIDNDEQCYNVTDNAHHPDKKIDDEYMNNIISNAINKLKPEQQKTIKLILIEGHSYKETAKILDIPISSVKAILHRAKNKLKNNKQLLTLA